MSASLHEPQRPHLRPLPLWERATQSFNAEEWVRGTPHPTERVELSAMPSPTRGEGAITATQRAARP